jgi:exonuclease SbcC
LITRIELVNYMSHKHTVIEPAQGLTVLAGPNNCGKSAVADALRTVCGLNRGNYMVRHGEKTAGVRVTTADGHEVAWARRNDTVSWEIDGRTVHRDMPEDLHEKLRLPVVQPEGASQEFAVHFADQKQPLFLLEMPPSAPAVFFAAASDARHFITMRQTHKMRTQALKDSSRRLASELKRTEGWMAILEPVPALEAGLGDVERAFAELQRSLARAMELQEACAGLGQTQAAIAGLRREAAALEGLGAPPALLPTGELEQLLGSMAETRRRRAGLARTAACLHGFQAPPALSDTAALEGLVQAMGRERGRCAQAAAQAQALAPLPAPPAPQDPRPLAVLLDQLRDAAADAQAFLYQARDLDGERDAFAAQARAWLARNGTCPACGQVLSEAALMGGSVHGH